MNYYHISSNIDLKVNDKLLSKNYFEENILNKLDNTIFSISLKKKLYNLLTGNIQVTVEQLEEIEDEVCNLIYEKYSSIKKYQEFGGQEYSKLNELQVINEIVYEAVRNSTSYFSIYPSRLKIIFLTEKEYVKKWFRELEFKYGYERLTIYKVNIVRQDNIFHSYIPYYDTSIVKSAFTYWQQSTTSSILKETLLQGEIEIVEICFLDSFM
jgi:hypothetical protein